MNINTYSYGYIYLHTRLCIYISHLKKFTDAQTNTYRNTCIFSETNTPSHTHTCTRTQIFAQNWWTKREYRAVSISLQHTATHCNTLQHTATHCNTLQHQTRIPRGEHFKEPLFHINRAFFSTRKKHQKRHVLIKKDTRDLCQSSLDSL